MNKNNHWDQNIVQHRGRKLIKIKRKYEHGFYWEYGILDQNNKLTDGELLREYSNGTLCIGHYRNGELAGNAAILYKKETDRDFWGIYLGEWKNNMRNGLGITYSIEGNQMVSGIWKDDVLIKKNN